MESKGRCQLNTSNKFVMLGTPQTRDGKSIALAESWKTSCESQARLGATPTHPPRALKSNNWLFTVRGELASWGGGGWKQLTSH